MATVKTNVVTTKEVQLNLSHDQAQALRDILANVGGLGYGTRKSEKAAENIRTALADEGFRSRMVMTGHLSFRGGSDV